VFSSDLLYQIALTLVPKIGAVHAKILVEHFGSATAVFSAKRSSLEKIEGIGLYRAKSIKNFQLFSRAEQEIRFLDQYKVEPLFLTDKRYPRRLLNCYDSPVLLYYKGIADLNHERIIALIGTRLNTEYGKLMVDNIIRDLASHNIIVVALAHRAALKYRLPTIGVLGHGLDNMYPQEHIRLAREMSKEGGLLTEFKTNTKPDKHNFPIRNRIVAGMSDCTIVVETGIKGGSMITADLANGYHKDVFAYPGKTTDQKSTGCNELIKTNKAMLLTDAEQLLTMMGWNSRSKESKRITVQKEFFPTLTEPERKIVDILSEKSLVHIDEIHGRSNLSAGTIAGVILNLELKGVIGNLPGKIYRLI